MKAHAETVLEPNSDVLVIAVAAISVGILMLASVVRSAPKSAAANESRGEVVPVSTRSGKKSKKSA